MFPDVEVPMKTYSSPVLTTRSREQARFLVGHAWIGNSAARDLLKLFFPEPTKKQQKLGRPLLPRNRMRQAAFAP